MFDLVLKTPRKASIKASVSSTFLALAAIWLNTFFLLLCKLLFLPIFRNDLQALLYKTYFNSNEYLRKNIHNMQIFRCRHDKTQPAFTCSKLTIETLEQGVKYVQS